MKRTMTIVAVAATALLVAGLVAQAGAGAGVLRLNQPFWQADLEKTVCAAMARRATAAAAA